MSEHKRYKMIKEKADLLLNRYGDGLEYRNIELKRFLEYCAERVGPQGVAAIR